MRRAARAGAMARLPLVLLVAAAACRGHPDAAPLETGPTFEDPEAGLRVDLPAAWSGRYRVARETATTIGAERVWLFLYPPRDTRIVPQALMAVAVYDSAVWRQVSSGEGPPPGEELLRAGARVAVIGWPQSNPFPPGEDAATFDSLVIPRAELVRRLTLR
jgi:hypothetical protein